MEKSLRFSTGYITRVAVLGAIGGLLFLIPGIPIIGFYKMDFSTLPAILGGFALGPFAGFLCVLIKSLIGMLTSTTMYVGELADLLTSGTFVIVASMYYARHRDRRGALIGMGIATVVMSIVGALANYFILIPFYIIVMNYPTAAIVSMTAKTIPFIDSIEKVVLLATTPFNLLKGILLSALTFLLYKRLSPLLHGRKVI